MANNQEFAARLARIEARAKTGAKVEYAPLPEDADAGRGRAARRGIFSGIFGPLILPLAMVAFVGGAFATEILALLPANVVTASSPMSEMLRDGMPPEDPGAAASQAAPARAQPLLSN